MMARRSPTIRDTILGVSSMMTCTKPMRYLASMTTHANDFEPVLDLSPPRSYGIVLECAVNFTPKQHRCGLGEHANSEDDEVKAGQHLGQAREIVAESSKAQQPTETLIHQRAPKHQYNILLHVGQFDYRQVDAAFFGIRPSLFARVALVRLLQLDRLLAANCIASHSALT